MRTRLKYVREYKEKGKLVRQFRFRGRYKRLPVRDSLLKQGRFAHFIDEDIAYFQGKVDQMWEKWLIPGVIPFRRELEKE